MSIEDISADTGFEVNTIKAILMQCSSVFRKDTKKAPALEFDDDVQKEAMDIIVGMMRHECDDDPNLKFKVAKFVREDGNGRLDAGRALANLPGQLSVNFNLRFDQALKARERTLAMKKSNSNGEMKELEVVS